MRLVQSFVTKEVVSTRGLEVLLIQCPSATCLYILGGSGREVELFGGAGGREAYHPPR
jgi:hypothetical protein